MEARSGRDVCRARIREELEAEIADFAEFSAVGIIEEADRCAARLLAAELSARTEIPRVFVFFFAQ